MTIGYRCPPQSLTRMLGRLLGLNLMFIAGCASVPNRKVVLSGTNPSNTNAVPAHVTLALDDAATEHTIVQRMKFNGVRVDKNTDGDDLIYDSAAARTILVRYRRMLHAQLGLIAENVANANTTRDEKGAKNPYRRKILITDATAAIEIQRDRSPFIIRYQPGNPDADPKGYVYYPNVDLAIENVNEVVTSALYRMVTRILKQFDPTYLDVNDDDELLIGQEMCLHSPITVAVQLS